MEHQHQHQHLYPQTNIPPPMNILQTNMPHYPKLEDDFQMAKDYEYLKPYENTSEKQVEENKKPPEPPTIETKYVHFKFNITEISRCFNYWKKSLWFTPSQFLETAAIQDISQILVPHWIFNVDCVVTIKANVMQNVIDPKSNTLIQEWKDIYDQKICHFDDVIVLGIPTNIPHYVTILDCVKFWEPAKLLEKDESAVGWFMGLFKNLVSSQESKNSIPEHPVYPNDPWNVCFDRHCRSEIEKMEQEPATLFLRKKGYDSVSKITVTINELTQNFTKTLIYLPLYICMYQFDNHFYALGINGSTGYAVGERPYNPLGQLWQAGASGLQAVDNLIRGPKK